MEVNSCIKLEDAFSNIEREADVVLKVATAAVSAIRKFRSSAQTGNLRDLKKNMDMAERTVQQLKEQLEKAQKSWILNEEEYLSNHSAMEEILEKAREEGLKIFELDGRLYCHPLLIRILPEERCILIDRIVERRLRPTFLIRQLKQMQEKPSKFKPEAFLECLFTSYEILAAAKGKGTTINEFVVKLQDIYKMLTLLPGQNKNYTIQEFARDIYLLDKSRVNKTKRGFRMGFRASTGTKVGSPITVVTESGSEKKYYGISFESE